LDPNNAVLKSDPLTSMFPRNDTNVSDSSNGADIFVQTRGAASVFDNCVNVMLRPSPSLRDT
jgi:hypothetical protein